MNIKKLLILAPVAVLSMTSCGKKNVRYEAAEYFVQAKNAKYDAEKGLKILQLSDLHLGTNCDRKVQYAFIKETIDRANEYAGKKDGHDNKIDLIVISGDVFTFGTKEIVKDFCKFMDDQEIDWTLTFGNHDEQCYFSIDWLTGYLNNLSKQSTSHLLFNDHQDDDVFGNANFVINVPSSDSSKQGNDERVFIIDSNRYRYQIGSYGYDCIHNDQIDWYERCVRYNVEDTKDRHSLAFFHIPFDEYDKYYEEAKKTSGDRQANFLKDEDTEKPLDIKREGVSSPKEKTNLFDKMQTLGSTKGVFVGHDHINNYSIQLNPVGTNGMILSFGVKGTDTVYADDDLMGGQVITVRGNQTDGKQISVHQILHTYQDLKEVK